MKEYILCAANWYTNLELNKTYEFPKGHLYPINIKQGIVFCGHRHVQCLYQMIAMTGLRQHEAGGEEQGFLTNKNRFVSREEAAAIALGSGQIKEELPRLFSEDLY